MLSIPSIFVTGMGWPSPFVFWHEGLVSESSERSTEQGHGGCRSVSL